MGFFKYPYTDLNELNLDWVIAKIKYIEQAKNIIYDNSGTPLISNNVQDAIDELYNMISSQGVTTWNGRSGVVVPEAHDYTSDQVDYDNTISGLTATDAQAAIDEVNNKIPATIVEDFNGRSGNVTPTAGDYNGAQVTYDNTVSGLAATDIQAAVDELAAAPGGVTSFNTRTGAVVPAASDYTAAQVDFDDTVAQTGSSDVQGALEYVATRGSSAALTTYDNTQSGLTATNVQAAIDEVANDVLSSGVASFNGRTGAVNPAIGDYDLTELGDVAISTPAQDEVLKYDAVSQKWINGAGGGGGTIPSGYVIVEEVIVNPGSPSATIASRLKDLADAVVTRCASLANDEVLFLTYATLYGGGANPAKPMAMFDNTTSTFEERFFSFSIDVANNRYNLANQRVSTDATREIYATARTTTGGVTTVTDGLSTVTSGTFSINFIKCKHT